jgi:hypothetical protein
MSDVYLRAGLMLARALCIRDSKQRAAQVADFEAIDAAILDVERRAKDFDELHSWTTTIQHNSDKIIKKLVVVRKALVRQTELLRDNIADLKSSLPSVAECSARAAE